jgi:hypothetical protein
MSFEETSFEELDIEDLDVEELESRLEMAADGGWKVGPLVT